MHVVRIILVCGLMAGLSACGSRVPSGPPPAAGVKVGKPYVIAGETYYPEYDPHYDRTGTASWYGPGFHGGKTANGEKFDQDDLTAAHPTLPMPSLVRVTNLENGKSAIVRINDRGPFKDKRLIDLSRGSAKALDIAGLGKVRVQYLREETEAYWHERGLKTNDIQFAANDAGFSRRRGGLDGVIVPQDNELPPQIAGAAPVMSVASEDLTAIAMNDLQPEDLSIRPVESTFRVIDDAEASLPPPPSVSDPPTPLLPAEAPVPTPHPKVVHLYDSQGNPVAAPQGKGASKVVHVRNAGELDSAAPPEPASDANRSPPARELSGMGGWYIQAGAFSSEDNANRLAARLKPVGQVDVSSLESGERMLHRVRVGPFTDRESAENALSRLSEEGINDARIVHK